MFNPIKIFGSIGAKVLAATSVAAKSLVNLVKRGASPPSLARDVGDAIGMGLESIASALSSVAGYFKSQETALQAVPFTDVIGDEMAMVLPVSRQMRAEQIEHSYQVDIGVTFAEGDEPRMFTKYVVSPTQLSREEILDAAEKGLWASFRSASTPRSLGGRGDTQVVSMLITKYRIYGDING